MTRKKKQNKSSNVLLSTVAIFVVIALVFIGSFVAYRIYINYQEKKIRHELWMKALDEALRESRKEQEASDTSNTSHTESSVPSHTSGGSFGTNRSSYRSSGNYDEDGYDEEGYDRHGYDRNGYDRNGYDDEGFDEDGIDDEGYDEYDDPYDDLY